VRLQPAEGAGAAPPQAGKPWRPIPRVLVLRSPRVVFHPGSPPPWAPTCPMRSGSRAALARSGASSPRTSLALACARSPPGRRSRFSDCAPADQRGFGRLALRLRLQPAAGACPPAARHRAICLQPPEYPAGWIRIQSARPLLRCTAGSGSSCAVRWSQALYSLACCCPASVANLLVGLSVG